MAQNILFNSGENIFWKGLSNTWKNFLTYASKLMLEVLSSRSSPSKTRSFDSAFNSNSFQIVYSNDIYAVKAKSTYFQIASRRTCFLI